MELLKGAALDRVEVKISADEVKAAIQAGDFVDDAIIAVINDVCVRAKASIHRIDAAAAI